MIGLAAREVGLGLVQFTARRHTRGMQLAGTVQFPAGRCSSARPRTLWAWAWPNSGEVIQAITWPAFTFCPGCASMRAT